MIDLHYLASYTRVILTMGHILRTSWLTERGPRFRPTAGPTVLTLGSGIAMANLTVLWRYGLA